MRKSSITECRLYNWKALTGILLCGIVLFLSACASKSSENESQMSTKNLVASPLLPDGFEINLNHSHAVNLLRLDIYEDPLCPYCGELEESDIGQELNKLILMGKIDAHYHMANFLDPGSSSGRYSSIVNGLLLAVYQSDLPDVSRQKLWLAFHQRLYAKDIQPEEGQQDLSQSQLVRILHEVASQEKINLSTSLLKALKKNVYPQGKAIGLAASALITKKHILGTPDIWENNNTKELDMDGLSITLLDKLALA